MGMAGNALHYLTTNDWVLIQAKTELRTFKLGKEIIREGDWIQSLYIIRAAKLLWNWPQPARGRL
jgi:hypothetical protein